MTDVIIAPHGEGWTVRHPDRLHEHFAHRAHALRRAVAYARQLSRADAACGVREALRPLPERPRRKA